MKSLPSALLFKSFIKHVIDQIADIVLRPIRFDLIPQCTLDFTQGPSRHTAIPISCLCLSVPFP